MASFQNYSVTEGASTQTGGFDEIVSGTVFDDRTSPAVQVADYTGDNAIHFQLPIWMSADQRSQIMDLIGQQLLRWKAGLP